MSNIVRNYQLTSVEKVNKASNLIKRLKDVTSAYIDKEKQLLRLELNLNDKDKRFNKKVKSIEEEILKILKSLNLSGFDTSNVTNMSYMFSSCSGLTSLDVSSFNTTNVINMDSMFHACESLTSLDVSNFDTSNVSNMSMMLE